MTPKGPRERETRDRGIVGSRDRGLDADPLAGARGFDWGFTDVMRTPLLRVWRTKPTHCSQSRGTRHPTFSPYERPRGLKSAALHFRWTEPRLVGRVDQVVPDNLQFFGPE